MTFISHFKWFSWKTHDERLSNNEQVMTKKKKASEFALDSFRNLGSVTTGYLAIS